MGRRGGDPDIDARIRSVAAASHGVVTCAAAEGAGIDRRAVTRRVGTLLERTRHGQLVVPELVDAWTAVVLATQRSRFVAVTYGFAAAAHGWDGCDRLLAQTPTLVVPWTSRADLRARRRRDLTRKDLVMVGPVRVTSPLWTLRTLGEVAAVKTLEHAVESSLRLGQVDEDDLWVGPHPALRRVLETRGRGTPPTGSWLETEAIQRVLRPGDIAVLARQVEVFEGATHHGRPDFLLPGWTILEVDGRQHADPAQKRRDNDRDLRLGGLGLRVSRLDWGQVCEAPATSARRLRRVIAEGRRAHGVEEPPLAGGCLRF